MTVANLNEMTKGWFVGNFEPSLYRTNDVEVAVKKYRKGDREERHYHKVATEFTVILGGSVRMGGTVCNADSIVRIEPGEATDFECLEDALTVVVKIPGANNDKYVER